MCIIKITDGKLLIKITDKKLMTKITNKKFLIKITGKKFLIKITSKKFLIKITAPGKHKSSSSKKRIEFDIGHYLAQNRALNKLEQTRTASAFRLHFN